MNAQIDLKNSEPFNIILNMIKVYFSFFGES